MKQSKHNTSRSVKNYDKYYDRRDQEVTSAYKNDPDAVFSDQKDSMGHNISPER